MKYLIVNGDDFGASHGINLGIIEAHRYGILTSASLMVSMPGSEGAARLSRDLPDLSVGLHIILTDEDCTPLFDFADANKCRTQLEQQFCRFQELMGQLPTHLDAHHNMHRDVRLRSHFIDLSRRFELPLREHSLVRYFSNFYGQWDGETHLEQIGVESLSRMLEVEVKEGFTELSCHPGYVCPDFNSTYFIERETELRTLCDPNIPDFLARQQIRLTNYRNFIDLRLNG
jgi:predicted glycoside hydrolase/deacetylase ChbG (UPF0249 family)